MRRWLAFAPASRLHVTFSRSFMLHGTERSHECACVGLRRTKDFRSFFVFSSLSFCSSFVINRFAFDSSPSAPSVSLLTSRGICFYLFQFFNSTSTTFFNFRSPSCSCIRLSLHRFGLRRRSSLFFFQSVSSSFVQLLVFLFLVFAFRIYLTVVSWVLILKCEFMWYSFRLRPFNMWILSISNGGMRRR